MTELLTLLIALLCVIIGFLIGYNYAYLEVDSRKEKIQSKDQFPRVTTSDTIKQTKAGVIEYPSQEEIDYRESGEELVDKERERVFRENFKL